MYCRVCGKRTVNSPRTSQVRETAGSNGVTLKQSPMFRALLSHLHDLDIDHESAEIFPKRVNAYFYRLFVRVKFVVNLIIFTLILKSIRVSDKDAGFVYESLRNKTNRVIWKKKFHETNLSKTNPRNESTIRIFKVRSHESGFANPNLKDS